MPFFPIVVLLLLFLPSSTQSLAVVVEKRTCRLLPWRTKQTEHDDNSGDSSPCCLGWTTERIDRTAETYTVTFGVSSDDNDNSIPQAVIDLPYFATTDSLASSLWPSSLATAILISKLKSTFDHQSVLELGAGLGLTGRTVAATTNAASVKLTDNDDETIQRHQAWCEQHQEGIKLSAHHLDWRDQHVDKDRFDIILATDVAYYFVLLRPLMDTLLHYLRDDTGLALIVGQANRESQWDLYHNIIQGCYNVLTDAHEPPWEGDTHTRLYRLEMGTWKTTDSDDTDMDYEIDGEVPIAMLVHQRNGAVLPLTAMDHIATKHDEGSLTMTF